MRTDVPLPIDQGLLKEWLLLERTENKGYHHLLLRQMSPAKWKVVIEELVKYFENAHLDARVLFHRNAGIDLHPSKKESLSVKYPNCLPDKAKRGLFGEVLCGLISECYKFVGGYNWIVPVFLFRYHQDAENYIFYRARGEAERQVGGRLGDDFLALAINENGNVEGILVAESKFRKYLSPSQGENLVSEVHKKLSNDTHVPVNLMRFSELLKYKDAEGFESTRAHLERLSLLNAIEVVPRIDLICITVGKTKKKYPPTYIPQKLQCSEYKCFRELQAVEVIIEDACDLVDEIYQRLYSNGGDYDTSSNN